MTKAELRYLVSEISKEIKEEIELGENRFGPFHSLHEALAILREEYQELEQAIFWGNKNGENGHTVRLEALQVAAVATRIVAMLTPSPDARFYLSDVEKEVE